MDDSFSLQRFDVRSDVIAAPRGRLKLLVSVLFCPGRRGREHPKHLQPDGAGHRQPVHHLPRQPGHQAAAARSEHTGSVLGCTLVLSTVKQENPSCSALMLPHLLLQGSTCLYKLLFKQRLHINLELCNVKLLSVFKEQRCMCL